MWDIKTYDEFLHHVEFILDFKVILAFILHVGLASHCVSVFGKFYFCVFKLISLDT